VSAENAPHPGARSERAYITAIWLAVSVFLALVAFLAYSLNKTVKAENEKSFTKNLSFLAESSAKSSQLFFEGMVSELLLLTEIDVVKNYRAPEADLAFRGVISKHKEAISHMILLNDSGETALMVTKDPDPSGVKPFVTEFFKETMPKWRVHISPRMFVSPTYRGIAVGSPIFRKVADEKKEKPSASGIYASGMIIALIGADDLVGRLVEPVRAGQSGFAWLSTEGGDILANNARMEPFIKSVYGPGGDFGRFKDEFDNVIKGVKVSGWTPLGETGTAFKTSLGGDDWYVSLARVRILDQVWSLAVAEPGYEAELLLNRSFWQSVILLSLVTLILALGGWLMTQANRRLVRAQEKELHAVELEAKNRSLEELNRRMDEFVAVVSHDIRSPLGVISGMLKLIQSSPEGAAFKRETSTSLRSCGRLMQLVTDILDVSKIEAGAARITYDELAVDDIIEESVKTMEFAAHEKGQSVTVELGAKTVMQGDGLKLLHVMNNLISNAIKFTPRGGAIHISKRTQDAHALIMVSDTGPGISSEERDAVFGKFEQLKRTQQGVEPGSGLGLAICKGYVELHGGTISVTGGEGHGSTFHVRIPLRRRALHS
jgi:signal transduction histidine kinase